MLALTTSTVICQSRHFENCLLGVGEAQAERLVQFGSAGGNDSCSAGRCADATLGYLRNSLRGTLRVKAI
nr:hypothetical protein [Mesorhizobium ventifaucium]